MSEKENWDFLKQIKNEIEEYLKEKEGVITIEQREDEFMLTARIAKEGKLKIHPDDIPRCKHILG